MEQTLSYYERNKERLKQQAREYHYRHRDEYNAYSKEYYATHKDVLNAKRRAKKIATQTRQRAHLIKPNKTDELETRRKTYEDLRLNPIKIKPIEEPEPVIVWTHTLDDFTVRFD